MKHLKVWQRFVLMAAVTVVPFSLVTHRMLTTIDDVTVKIARQQLLGLEYARPLVGLIRNLQQHRGIAVTMLSGNESLRGRLEAKRADVERDLQALGDVDRRLGEALETTARWTTLRDGVRGVLDRGAAGSAAGSFDTHTQTLKDAIALLAHVGDTSNLTLDPDIESYYLMNLAIFQGPELSEVLAQARGLGSSIVESGRATPEQLARMGELAALTAYLDDQAQKSFLKAAPSGQALVLTAEAAATANATRDARAHVARLIAARGAGLDSADYFETLTKSIESIFSTQERVTAQLEGLLRARIDRFVGDRFRILLWIGIGLLLLSTMGYLFMRDATTSLGQVVELAHQIAAGDLEARSALHTRRDELGVLGRAVDEMSAAQREMVLVAERIAAGDLAVAVAPRSDRDALGRALAHMVERLSGLVTDVHKSGIQVNTSVNEIAATARQQHATATEIAATTTQIGATSKEIAATSKALVKTMGEVSAVADETAALAGSGQTNLTRMEETMRHVMEAAGTINGKLAVLNQKAGSITQVVTAISKVADQTNLLSLNAAIEAEKAGDYGRGFAVVATEIRRLADQTALATSDIEQMVKDIQSAVTAGVMGMDKFAEEVRRGMQDIQQVGEQLSQVIQNVQALAPRVEAVNEGMQAQAAGAEQITESLAQLSSAAQQTVESLRQANQVVEGLNQAASSMRGGVSRFKLVA